MADWLKGVTIALEYRRKPQKLEALASQRVRARQATNADGLSDEMCALIDKLKEVVDGDEGK